MRKIDRLFEIIQLLRGKRLRTAAFIAEKLGVSVRTIYRDIQGLMASGIPIEGERGIGYVIRQPIELPPLKFTSLELKALQLGIKIVIAITDQEIAQAAKEAAIKIQDVLPNYAPEQENPIAYIYYKSSERTVENLTIIRKAIDGKQKIKFAYTNTNAIHSSRSVRPLGLEYWGKVWTLTAWCELRNSFRVFRIDRIFSCVLSSDFFKHENGKRYQDYLKQFGENYD